MQAKRGGPRGFGAREATIDAAKEARYIVARYERGSDSFGGFTRTGVATYATITPVGLAAIGLEK